jgi:hypothetical protein
MKVLMISAVAAIAAGIQRSRLLSTNVGTAGVPTMQELRVSANLDKLPEKDFEDRSLNEILKLPHQAFGPFAGCLIRLAPELSPMFN